MFPPASINFIVPANIAQPLQIVELRGYDFSMSDVYLDIETDSVEPTQV